MTSIPPEQEPVKLPPSLIVLGVSKEDAGMLGRVLEAAPDLYEALDRIVTYCDTVPRDAAGMPQHDGRLLYELYHAAKAALRKARGEPL